MMYTCYMESPVGGLRLEGDGERLHTIRFGTPPLPDDGPFKQSKAPFGEAIRQLSAYFSGSLKTFSLPIQIDGTPFQQQVWQALCEIPYGQTASYGEIARQIGRPGAARAVGGANHRNSLPIVIPCHRVVGAGGRLVGYGGGLHIKEALLDLERRHR